jgi:hypothetical protein
MLGITINQAEAYSQETFHCGNCNRDFSAKVITWVDVTRTPQVRQALLSWEFNIIQCSSCGSRQQADSPFFYEDFEEGLLIAMFPRIPERRGVVEASIRDKYGYYPVLEYFYDMTQLWTLLYLQEHYRLNTNLCALSRLGWGEQRLRKVLKFLKEDPMMIEIREQLSSASVGDAAEEDLMDLLARVIYTLEEMLPWPLDRRCVCGGDLTREFKCCGKPVELHDHERHLSRHYAIYCPSCGESLAGASCAICGKVYTWKLGTVQSYHKGVQRDRTRTVRPLERRADHELDAADQ